MALAVAMEEALAHPTDVLEPPGRLALAVAVGLFMAGFVLGNARTARTLLRERLAAGVASPGRRSPWAPS